MKWEACRVLAWGSDAALTLIALALAAPIARAQLLPDAGSILRQGLPPAFGLPPKPPPALKIETPEPGKSQTSSEIRFVLNQVRLTGQTVFTESELLALVQDLIGKEVGLADLEQATARVSRHYRERGYVVARAYLPAQELRDGIVEIAVLEGRIGRVTVENNSRVRDEVIAARVDSLQGRLVRDQDIDARLRLVYELSGVAPDARATLNPGANVGETDLALTLEKDPLISGTIELDNYGNRFTGGNRLSAQVNVHSPTGSGDLLSLRATEGLSDLRLYRLSYQVPVSASGLRLGGDYSHVRYRLGRTFSALEANGTAGSGLVFASHPLLLGQTYSAHARVSYQHSDIQDRIDSTSTVTDKTTHLGALAVTGDWLDRLGGGGTNAAALSLAAGKLNIETPLARAIDDVTAHTNGGYQKWNLSLMRLQRLGERVSLYLAYSGQKANKNLDSSEKIILGGPYGVKAYPQGEAPGDSGYLLNAELRYDLTGDWIPGRMQLLAFVDAGSVKINEEPFVSGPNRRQLGSAGLGGNWFPDRSFQIRLVVAQKLGGERALSDTDRPIRGWLQMIFQF